MLYYLQLNYSIEIRVKLEVLVLTNSMILSDGK